MSTAPARLCEAGVHAWTRELRTIEGVECVVATCDVCGAQELCWAPPVEESLARGASAKDPG